MTKSLDPGMEILTAPSKTQEGHAVRFRLKLKQLSSSSFSNSSLDGNSPKTRSRRGLGSSKVFRSSFENFAFTVLANLDQMLVHRYYINRVSLTQDYVT